MRKDLEDPRDHDLLFDKDFMIVLLVVVILGLLVAGFGHEFGSLDSCNEFRPRGC